MRKKYNIVFTFAFGDDIIQYLTQRECTDLETMADYVKMWLDKYEYKYGEFMWCKIYEGKDLVYAVLKR